jgi:hypothetical protein
VTLKVTCDPLQTQVDRASICRVRALCRPFLCHIMPFHLVHQAGKVLLGPLLLVQSSAVHLLRAQPPLRRLAVDKHNPQSTAALFDATCTATAEVFSELRQCRPLRRVHVDMFLVLDVVLVHRVRRDRVTAVPLLQDAEEAGEEVLGKAIDKNLGLRREQHEVALMRRRSGVALEPVLVATLLFTHLAIQAQAAQAVLLLAFGNRLETGVPAAHRKR